MVGGRIGSFDAAVVVAVDLVVVVRVADHAVGGAVVAGGTDAAFAVAFAVAFAAAAAAAAVAFAVDVVDAAAAAAAAVADIVAGDALAVVAVDCKQKE